LIIGTLAAFTAISAAMGLGGAQSQAAVLEEAITLTCVGERGNRRQPNTYAEMVPPETVDLGLRIHFPSLRSCERFKPNFESYFNNPAAESWDDGPVDNLAALGVFRVQGELFIDHIGRAHLFEASEDATLERPETVPNTIGEGGIYATTRLPPTYGSVLAFTVDRRSLHAAVVFENTAEGETAPHVYRYGPF